MQGIEKEEIRFSIGQLAKIAGISLSTIRYYQRLGLFYTPERNGSSFRVYHIRDLQRLQQIKGAQALGFTLSEIEHLLDPVDGDHCNKMVTSIQAKLVETETKAEKLALARAQLKALLMQCEGQCPESGCQMLHELSKIGSAQ